MDQLVQRIKNIPNSYFEFVDSVVDYAESKSSHVELLIDFLDEHPMATPSDVIRFISYQPDFFEDSVPVKVDTLAG